MTSFSNLKVKKMVPFLLWHGLKNDLLRMSNFSYLLRDLTLSFLMWHGLENDLLKVSNFCHILKNLKLLKSGTVLHCTNKTFKVRTLLRISKVFFYPSNSYYLKLVNNFLVRFNQKLSSIPKKIIT